MKRILHLSLLLNVALLVSVAWRHPQEPPMPRPPRGEVRPAHQWSARGRVRSRASAAETATPWSRIEDRDPQRFLERLRAIGCPEQTIRDIVTFRVCREFQDRWIALRATAAQAWDYTRQPDWGWQERNWQQQELRDEMHSTLEALFGQSWQSLTAAVRGGAAGERDGLESLSVDARRKIREVDGKFRRELDELQRRWGTGDMELADLNRLRELERQKRATLGESLSPAEHEEYLYRHSAAADYVRRNLPAAKSESEFRATVKLAMELGLNETTDAPRSLTPTDDIQRELAERKAAFDQRLLELLGEARLAEQEVEEQARKAADQKEQEAQRTQRAWDRFAAMVVEAGASAEEAGRLADRMEELGATLKTKFDELEKRLTGTKAEKEDQMEAAKSAEFEKIAVEIMGETGRALMKKIARANK